MTDKPDALVIGGGPAGLMAADVLAGAGHSVVLTEGMPTVGRKFLMAGKSGLNLTRDEEESRFLARYSDLSDPVRDAVSGFGPVEVVAWAEGLGEPTFAGSTGRIFPKVMKASPLLRKWLARLDSHGVERRVRWRWIGWDYEACVFETHGGQRRISPRVTILAMGGGSWRKLGSDGVWQQIFVEHGIPVSPFTPSNVGFAAAWSPHMVSHIGSPVKNTQLAAGNSRSRGEWIVTARGIEGGGVYDVSRHARGGATITVDLFPDLTVKEVGRRLDRPRGKASLSNHLRIVLKLEGVRRALLLECARPLPDAPDDLARAMKSLALPTTGPLPLDEAISTGGGVASEALDGFALKARPDTFCAGEMLGWDAPTGGYLLTACLATWRAAALAALARL